MLAKTLIITILVAVQIIRCKTAVFHTCIDDTDVVENLKHLKTGISSLIVVRSSSDNPLSYPTVMKIADDNFNSVQVSSVLVVPAESCHLTYKYLFPDNAENNFPYLFMLRDGTLIRETMRTSISRYNVEDSYNAAAKIIKKGNSGDRFDKKIAVRIENEALLRADQEKKALKNAGKRAATASASAPRSATHQLSGTKQPIDPVVVPDKPYKRSNSLPDHGRSTKTAGSALRRSTSQHEPPPPPPPNPARSITTFPVGTTSPVVPFNRQFARPPPGQTIYQTAVNRPMFPSYAASTFAVPKTQNLLPSGMNRPDDAQYRSSSSNSAPSPFMNLDLSLGGSLNSETTGSPSEPSSEPPPKDIPPTLNLFK